LDLVDTLLHDPVKVAAAPVSSPVEVIRQEVCLVDRKNKTALLLEKTAFTKGALEEFPAFMRRKCPGRVAF